MRQRMTRIAATALISFAAMGFGGVQAGTVTTTSFAPHDIAHTDLKTIGLRNYGSRGRSGGYTRFGFRPHHGGVKRFGFKRNDGGVKRFGFKPHHGGVKRYGLKPHNGGFLRFHERRRLHYGFGRVGHRNPYRSY